MNRNILKIVACCVLLSFTLSCRKARLCECWQGAGSPSTDVRAVDPFNQIVVKDNINVFLSMGPQHIEIDGAKNLIQNITTDVSGGVLTLQNNNICNWMKSYKKSIINVYITMPDIAYITNEGVGNVQSTDTITAGSFQVQIKSAGDINLMVRSVNVTAHLFGAGDLTLTGTTGNFLCNFFGGTGFIYTDNLNSGYTFLASSTTGDCYITSKGIMDVTIYNIGNVYYSGNPTLIRYQTYGKGQLMKE